MQMKKNILKLFLFVIVLITILFFSVACVEIVQYKRIGDTNFYLVETMAISSEGKPLPGLYYSRRPQEKGFSGVSLGAIPFQLFWNNRYIVVKCTDRDSKRLIKYCIIKILNTAFTDPEDNYELHEYTTEEEYEGDGLLWFERIGTESNR